MQLQIPLQDVDCKLVLNQTKVAPAVPGFVSIVLDIDLFRTEDLPQNDEEIWRFFETLHVKKNDIFEACIIDRTRELFR